MNDFHLNIKAVAKSFRMHNFLFRDMSFDLTNSAVTALTGKNGSGKSTMLKICAGLLKPTEGTVELSLNGELLKKEQFNRHFGFVAPYLNLYDE
ncbi:MAG: ATP-binding cassette domain-containing protein, partial [Chlorobi bacterium]|nr:ATP-binding cassette domain-containing protein [Chlorobiota bacterium]